MIRSVSGGRSGARRLRRRLRAAAVAAFAALALTTALPPAAADPANLRLTWVWGGDGTNTCTMGSYVGAYPEDGHVVIRATWHGCTEPLGVGSGDGTLNVTGWGPDGRRYGGGTPLCTEFPCSYAARVPFTGPGTYCGLAYVTDSAYLVKHGTDPHLRPCRHVG